MWSISVGFGMTELVCVGLLYTLEQVCTSTLRNKNEAPDVSGVPTCCPINSAWKESAHLNEWMNIEKVNRAR